jgi:hypothetical protein
MHINAMAFSSTLCAIIKTDPNKTENAKYQYKK